MAMMGVLGMFLGAALSAPIDWAQPPVACVDQLLPQLLPCPDLSRVSQVWTEVPADWTEDQVAYWTREHKADLRLCRARETLRREQLEPGSQPEATVEVSWMIDLASAHLPEKWAAIQQATRDNGVPPTILYGALMQESLLSELAIADDGGNFSCGIGQINLQEWCRWAESLSPAAQAAIGWPHASGAALVSQGALRSVCAMEGLPNTLLAGFQSIAMSRAVGLPEYRLRPEHYRGITFDQVSASFPAGSVLMQAFRFAAASSFALHCMEPSAGIAAKAHELRTIFDTQVPAGLREKERYAEGDSYARACSSRWESPYYPLHTGWLMADAIYNAGTRMLSIVSHYYRMTAGEFSDPKGWSFVTPTRLIEGLHWGGKYNSKTDLLDYQDVNGRSLSSTWFKSCIVQRHVARVIQYSTLPAETIAQSLEVGGCSKSLFDEQGNLVETRVPEYRRKSKGQIAARPALRLRSRGRPIH